VACGFEGAAITLSVGAPAQGALWDVQGHQSLGFGDYGRSHRLRVTHGRLNGVEGICEGERAHVFCG